MANINRNEISTVFRRALGRLPNEKELAEWTSKSHYDPSWNDPVNAQHGTTAFNILRSTPEGQSFAETGVPIGRRTPPAQQTATQSTQNTQYNPTVQPYNATSDQSSYQAAYQPNVTAGNVQPYVPSGANYSPTPGSTYYPSNAGAAPTTATGDYSGIPLNSAGLPTINIKGEDGFPSFAFNMNAEQTSAYQRLEPFYQKLLSFAGGRLDLAKRIIDYTYQQGMRESSEEYDSAKREQAIQFPVEQEEQQTSQNRRGILESGFGKTDVGRLTESQDIRKKAVEDALANRTSRLTSQRGFGLEEKQQGFEEERFGQERERRTESSGMAMDKFNIKQSQFGMDLAKAQREENRAIQAKQDEYTKKSLELAGG